MTGTISIIPLPVKMQITGKVLRLSDQSHLCFNPDIPEVAGIAEYLHTELWRSWGFTLRRATTGSAAADAPGITVSLVSDESAAEGAYRLEVDEGGAVILAGTPAGLFYGVQSLLQLLPEGGSNADEVILPGVMIIDRPQFSWRGMHLDVSRHFFPPDFIMKYIDLLARHKMNVFHWHLTDDQGWRIESEQYPRLTQVGAWRKEADGQLYGGFYTQQEIREIVAYAKCRFVTIIPEIEMPGHASAALAAYPEYSCTGGLFEVETRWGVFDDVYCAGNEATFEFLANLLDEVTGLFPGQYLHIGGDECPKIRWNNHQLCRDLMKKAGLANADELQAHFISRIARYLETIGRRLVGWDEILDGGAPEGATIMAWRDIQKGIEAARSGHDVIMTPMSHCYFDHYQGKTDEPKAIGGFTPLEKVYAFEPIPPDLPPELARHVLGGQGNVWTEYMPDTKHVEYMAFPRLCALSEVLWSPRESRSLSDFLDRLRQHLKRLDRLGVNYRRLTN
jgi:hexosaminidase